MNKKLLIAYEINKNGFISTDSKQCLCGETVEISVNTCPKCGADLKKTKLLNVNKNNVLKKKTEISFEDNIFIYCIRGLFSKGFELYENSLLEFKMDLTKEEVTISDTKYFKTNGDSEALKDGLEKYLPGFYSFVIKSLREQSFEYAKTKFASLTADQIENFLHVYCNYRTLIPYFRGYKVLNYGKNVDLKSYYPNIDFNSEDDIKKLSIYLPVFLTYDFKNVKYMDTIVQIYEKESSDDLKIFNNCIDKLLSIANSYRNRWEHRLDYNTVNDTFSVLYNHDISFQDFLRIFLASREDYFSKLLEVKKNLKKVYGKFSWNDIEKIDRKLYGSLCTKATLKTKKISKENIEVIYKTLEKDPIESLRLLL